MGDSVCLIKSPSVCELGACQGIEHDERINSRKHVAGFPELPDREAILTIGHSPNWVKLALTFPHVFFDREASKVWLLRQLRDLSRLLDDTLSTSKDASCRPPSDSPIPLFARSKKWSWAILVEAHFPSPNFVIAAREESQHDVPLSPSGDGSNAIGGGATPIHPWDSSARASFAQRLTGQIRR